MNLRDLDGACVEVLPPPWEFGPRRWGAVLGRQNKWLLKVKDRSCLSLENRATGLALRLPRSSVHEVRRGQLRLKRQIVISERGAVLQRLPAGYWD